MSIGFYVQRKKIPLGTEETVFFFQLRGTQAWEFLGIYGSLHWTVQPGPQGNTFKIKMAVGKFQLFNLFVPKRGAVSCTLMEWRISLRE